ncbi:Glyoxylase, beta-lactamase superfamily II [Geobacter sp. DSM 9736]|nr:Glyoxylase, beta-lactamase superfamily II [Geobacter sp. DSM 9736]
MKKLNILFPFLLFFLMLPRIAPAAHYEMKKVSDSVYAAVALPAGKAGSNAMVIISDNHVILAGSHFVPEAVKELLAEVSQITSFPVKEVILTHHHSGYNYIDLDLPVNASIFTSWQTWQSLNSEYRRVKNPVTIFENALTLQRGQLSIVLSNTGKGHSAGDVVVYIPNEDVLFTSDLLFNGVVGYMGNGYMRDWVMNLEMLESLTAATVIPGVGSVTDSGGISAFLVFMREFLTEVLRHVEKGENLAQTKKGFSLPAYQQLPGYKTFFNVNIERAYGEFKSDQTNGKASGASAR